ncbi:asparagine synthetase [glutamine-hydrolyzing]-like isoform X2 [Gordionus sp. m RMFG-2023]|uniref:asparagine synthetase [glutamine-hydrolyzing]-like isoform X2 n=1 Tax=Gordionus sp. m RMFG-2023 TaxID=3053472 RepID=UPI0031FD4088
MCGIFAYMGRTHTLERLRPHFDKISHRGPEFSKLMHLRPDLVFGFHRLAIIDSSELGNQPIFHPDDPEKTIIVNGEIYNYKALKEVYDYTTRSGSDSDVMLHLYHHFGVEAMLKELDGVFAFVIRDHDKLILGNDIIGVRPLFVAYLPGGEWAVASEEKTLIGLDPLRVERFKPGTFVVQPLNQAVSSETGLKYHPYFDWFHGPERLDMTPLKFADEQTVCSTLEEYLIQSVKKRLVSDRPVGCLLSGGLDSSLVTSIVARYYSGDKATVHHSTSCALGKTQHGTKLIKNIEGKVIDASTHTNGTLHIPASGRRSYSPSSDTNFNSYQNDDLKDDLDKSISSHDANQNYATANNVTSSLIGQSTCTCARQPHLATLHTFSIGMTSDRGASRSPDLEYAEMVAKHLGTQHHRVEFTFDEAWKVLRDVIYSLGSWDCTTVRASIPQYLLAKYVKAHSDVKVLLSGEGADEIFGSYSYFKKAPNPESFTEECVHLCRNLYQFDALRADRTLSAFGLELREPFLDKKLLPYVLFRVPALMKMHGVCGDDKIDSVKPRAEKHILRRAFEGDYLPAPVLWRSKEAFSDGVNYEFRDRLIEKINSLISDSEFQEVAPNLPTPVPLTKEAYYYRKIYDEFFSQQGGGKGKRLPLVDKNWMPNPEWFGEEERKGLVDPSARVLSTYDVRDSLIEGGKECRLKKMKNAI